MMRNPLLFVSKIGAVENRYDDQAIDIVFLLEMLVDGAWENVHNYLLVYSCCDFEDGSWSKSSLNIKQEVSFVSGYETSLYVWCTVRGRAESYALG